MPKLTGQNTLKIIAENLGVSITTVSRVLNGQSAKYRISKQTEQIVRKEATRIDYEPNLVAKSLRLQKTQTLGLLVTDIANPFFGTLARHIDLESRKNGYSILLCDSGSSTEIEIELLRLLESRNVDGVIASPVGQRGDHFEQLKDKGMPMVVVDRYFKGMSIPFVTSDNYKASFEATKYLLSKGHRRIGCIQGLPECLLNTDRVNGYKDALTEYGVAFDDTLVVGNQYNRDTGYNETKRLLGYNPRPTAIFSLGSSMAFGAFAALMEEGVKVPEDISIISFDEQPYFPFLATPLTAIAQQNSAMGEIAVKMIINCIEGRNKPVGDGVFLETKFNIRKSVRDFN
jgi:LacI family transcriptional regulator